MVQSAFGFLVLLLLALPSSTNSLKIGAFNIQTFGRTKFSNDELMQYITQIVRQYDVCLIQEIRDVSGVVIPGLLEKLQNNGEKWDVSYSERLGRSSYKEQYAYYYRTDKLTAVSDYQFDDGVDDGSDDFEREPYGVMFESFDTENLRRFGLLGVHIKPSEAVSEINALPRAVESAKQFWRLEDVMILGDFNADCSYVNDNELATLDLKTDPSYLWVIGDYVDTTSSTTDCAYDRMVVTGNTFRQSVDLSSAGVNRFDLDYGLDYEQARRVSDHYPVEVDVI